MATKIETYSPRARKYQEKSNTRKLIRDDGLTVWYSYSTPIGFKFGDFGYVNERGYSVTTAKHKNYMRRDPDFPSASCTLPESDFITAFREATKQTMEVSR